MMYILPLRGQIHNSYSETVHWETFANCFKWYRIKIDVDPTLSNKYFYTFTLRSEPLDEILRIMARIQPMKYTFNEENELTISFADTKQKVK